MKRGTKNAWLFAFTDLSFLLLICLSLIPSTPNDVRLHIAAMDLPAVPDNQNLRPLEQEQGNWELRISPVTTERSSPYLLTKEGKRNGLVLNETTLLPALEKLHDRGIRPVLLPDKSSFTQDFLFAAGTLARVWSTPRSRAVVRTLRTGAQR